MYFWNAFFILVAHRDKFLDENNPVTLDSRDFWKVDNKQTMNPHKLIGRQFLFDILHAQHFFNSQNGGTIWTLNGVILGLFFDFLEQTEIK